jgi:hypothetical protein
MEGYWPPLSWFPQLTTSQRDKRDNLNKDIADLRKKRKDLEEKLATVKDKESKEEREQNQIRQDTR